MIVYYEELIISVSTNKTFYLEDDDRCVVDFNGESRIFNFLLFKKNKNISELWKFKSKSLSVGGRHQSVAMSFEGDTTKTGQKISICECVQCNRKKSLIVSDNTTAAEGLKIFLEKLGRSSAKAGKLIATNLMKITGWALEIGAKIGSPAVNKSP